MKKKLVLKPFVIPTLYTVITFAVLLTMFLSIDVENERNDLIYVSSTILDEYVPVINTTEVMVKPYTNTTVTKVNDYYDYNASPEQQQSAIIKYENTYIQNTGIIYSSNEQFDVINVMNGEVIDVKEKELLGKSVTIKHDNELISVYQSLGEINVKKGDKVTTGQVIGKSGSCNLIKSSKNNLHFELYSNGTVVNPEEYYNKEINQ